ncbi:MAG: hypothetical protein ABIH52_02060, partial [Candidatus Aenigmatarchaeota archaeon]
TSKPESVRAEIVITNTGNEPIDSIDLGDTICEQFSLKNLEILHVSDGKTQLIEDIATDTDNGIRIEIDSIQEKIGKYLNHGDSINVKYEMILIKEKARAGKCIAPVSLSANTPNRGPDLKDSSEAQIEIGKKILGAHISKTITAGNNPDQMKISLYWKNTGEDETPPVELRDFVPSGFNIMESNPQPEVTDDDGGKYLHWSLGIVKKGQDVSMVYVIEGHGDYKARDAVLLAKE